MLFIFIPIKNTDYNHNWNYCILWSMVIKSKFKKYIIEKTNFNVEK